MTLLKGTPVGRSAQITIFPHPPASDEEPATAINAVNCLKFIATHINTLTAANMTMLSAAVVCVLCESDWAETRKPKREIISALARTFNETPNANHGAGRSKRYEFAYLACQIAETMEGKALATAAIRGRPMEPAIRNLAEQFRELAPSVAALARHFGTRRSSGRRQDNPQASFLDWLRKAVERALRAGTKIQMIDAVDVLLSAASEVELLQIASRLLMRVSDEGLRELGEIIERTLKHRQSQAAGKDLKSIVGP